MIQAKRLGSATFETTDLDRQIDYFQEVVGLVLVAREKTRAVLATKLGQLAVILETGETRQCTGLSFEISPAVDLGAAARRLSQEGIGSETRSDSLPGIPETLVFTDPKGTRIELFSNPSFLPVSGQRTGAGAFKLGHLAFVVPDPAATAAFYERVLGFRVSDWIGDFFVFLRCNADHHSVNFIRGSGARIHHVAFEMKDAAHLHGTCDLLGDKNIPVIWGPVRHGPGHNLATYHRDPDDTIVEFFAELDRMSDEEAGYFDPRPWHRDRPQRPKVWDGTQPRERWGLAPSPDFLRQAQLRPTASDPATPQTPAGAAV